MTFAQSKKRLSFCIAVIFLGGVLVYANTFGGAFVWDDERLILENPQIKDWGSLPEIFTSSLRSPLAAGTSSFRPLQTLTYLIDYSFWQSNPFGYHLTNITFHVAAALALFVFIQTLFGRTGISFITAFLFVIHPIHTEAVAYVSGRADPMAAFFMILTFCLYLRSRQKPAGFRVVRMSLCYLAALLSRENALVLPFLILLHHFTFKSPVFKKPFAGIMGAVAVYIFWRWLALKGMTLIALPPTTLWQRAPGIFVALTNYIRLLFVPFGLHMEYGELLFNWSEPKIYIGLILLSGLLFLAYKERASKLVLFAAGWFFITLIPASNIYPLNAYMAEHWLYLPSMGYCLILAGVLDALYKKDRCRVWAAVLCIGLTVYYGGMTVHQNNFWRDPVRLYKRMLTFNPDSTRLYTNLANESLKAGRKEDMIGLLKKAIEIDPSNAVAYNNLGIAYKRAGRYDEALRTFEQGMAYNPEYAGLYYNIGIIYADVMGRGDQAIPMLNMAVEKDPSFYRGYHKVGMLFWEQGKKDEAVAMLKKALKVNPGAPEIYHSLGFMYHKQGHAAKAIEHYKKAIHLNPKFGKGYSDLAIVYFYQKQYRLAIEYCDKAAALGYKDAVLLKALQAYR